MVGLTLPNANSRHIWLLQDGEPLPTDANPRLMRTGDLATRLADAGFVVTWWTSRFDHKLKKYRQGPDGFVELSDRYRLRMLDGPSYTKNMSLGRMLHYRSLAAQFLKIAESAERPDVILGSFPSPELCAAGARFARQHDVPFIVDIRDPWPDIFRSYFHPALSWTLAPILAYYRRMTRAVMRSADGILAVSESMLDWGVQYANRARRDRDAVFFIGYNKPRVERDIIVPERFTEDNPLKCLFATTCGVSYDGETVIKAARLLEASGERRASFVLSGDGECRARWMELAAGLSTVRFTGWISHEELQELFDTSHVGLILMRGGITPFWLGNKFGEYLSTSLALVSNVEGESAAMIDNHQLGINVEPNDAHAVAEAIRSLVNSPGTVRTAMLNSRKVFNDAFERREIYKRYVAYLEQAATRPHRRARS